MYLTLRCGFPAGNGQGQLQYQAEDAWVAVAGAH